MGKQFVRRTTHVVSAAQCHNWRRQNRVLQSLQGICCSKWVGWGDLVKKHGTIYNGNRTVFWWFTNVMCVPKVHVSYCARLLESVIQIGGPIAVLHNRWHLIQSQWLHDLSKQSVLGLHDLWTCLPVTFIHREHCRKMFCNNNPLTLAELEANA